MARSVLKSRTGEVALSVETESDSTFVSGVRLQTLFALLSE